MAEVAATDLLCEHGQPLAKCFRDACVFLWNVLQNPGADPRFVGRPTSTGSAHGRAGFDVERTRHRTKLAFTWRERAEIELSGDNAIARTSGPLRSAEERPVEITVWRGGDKHWRPYVLQPLSEPITPLECRIVAPEVEWRRPPADDGAPAWWEISWSIWREPLLSPDHDPRYHWTQHRGVGACAVCLDEWQDTEASTVAQPWRGMQRICPACADRYEAKRRWLINHERSTRCLCCLRQRPADVSVAKWWRTAEWCNNCRTAWERAGRPDLRAFRIFAAQRRRMYQAKTAIHLGQRERVTYNGNGTTVQKALDAFERRAQGLSWRERLFAFRNQVLPSAPDQLAA
jgi:hypothetical protein